MRQQRERRLKIEFAFFQSLSQLFIPTHLLSVFSFFKVRVAVRLNAETRRLLEIQNLAPVYTIGLLSDPIDRSPF